MKIRITDRSTDTGLMGGTKKVHPSPELLKFMFECAVDLRQCLAPELAARIELIHITFFQPALYGDCEPTFHIIWNTPNSGKQKETFDGPPYDNRPTNRTFQRIDQERYVREMANRFLTRVRASAHQTAMQAEALRALAAEIPSPHPSTTI